MADLTNNVNTAGGAALALTMADISNGAGTAFAPTQATVDQFGTKLIASPTTFKTVAAVAVTAGTPVAVWTPASGKKFRLMGYALSLSVAGAVILKDSGTELIRTPALAAGTGTSCPPLGNGILSAAANNALQVDASATGTVQGFVYGVEQ